jgi:hypothetical protein
MSFINQHVYKEAPSAEIIWGKESKISIHKSAFQVEQKGSQGI